VLLTKYSLNEGKMILNKLSSPFEEKAITKKLKTIRLSKQLTLDKLSKLSGLTKGYLSQIENSTQPPPIYTLSRIANALQIDIAELFVRTQEPIPYQKMTISRHDKRKPMDRVGTRHGYIYEDLALQKKGKNMEPFLVTVGFERKVDISKDFCHEGEEFLYVIEGRMEFFYDGESYILEEGDSVYFDADVPHSGKSLGDKKVKALIVIYSYKRM
jgi:transcriptional regulator with XRE-family HTH domain